MGQKQSVQDSQAGAKASYYDLLALDRCATDDDIKKAYRRKALELHPDRNYGNVEEATRQFAEVQAAYEVLSDPQERAWYDSHEDAILSGEVGGAANETESTSAEDIAKLFAHFDGREDYTDSSTGFFSTLRDVFARLAHEEILVSDSAGLTPIDYPSFGTSEDDYQSTVKNFYDVWSGFTTRKSFLWRDVYRLNDAPDRRTRRAMEKENKRLRDEAIKDFNYTVRTLVSFLKKRDPRLNIVKQSEATRQQILREQSTAQAAKARAANIARFEEQEIPAWVQSDTPEHDADESTWDNKDEEIEERYECVVCEKTFKTENQYDGHARSKKHKQAVRLIQQQMKKEGIDLGIDPERDAEDGTESLAKGVTVDVFDTSDASLDHADQPKGPRNDSARVVNIDQQKDSQSSAEDASQSKHEAKADPSGHDDDYASRESVTSRILGMESLSVDERDISDDTSRPKRGKAKQKRAKRAARRNAAPVAPMRCESCDEHFSSKNQLFNHLKQNSSHVQLKTENGRKSK